ncbi:peptidase [Prosthecomicrobium hirschii]|uniref:Peptidase n=1 Tax=Prosthecodimorpha hirschii TaxID=665126 RepID=A0A0P6W3A4_9HYPH|nr:peptidase [Prosthecomicrobium hirschii]
MAVRPVWRWAVGLAALCGLGLPAQGQSTAEESRAEIVAARNGLPADAAKVLFGSMTQPAPLAARSIGSYARGCLAGGIAMPVNGPAWQVMRLSRNRNWGHPALIAYLERFAEAARRDGWPGLLIGDMSQPRGGPMLTGHASHQIGLDADIWLLAMPQRELLLQERESISAVSMVKMATREIDARVWTEAHARLIRRAASDAEVARIFVHPAIKKALCDWKDGGPDRARWLGKVRPWYGHNYHFHVRLACPAGIADCKDQDKPPEGDGCGTDLAWWLGPEPWKPSPPSPPKPPMKLADLPETCAQVLATP